MVPIRMARKVPPSTSALPDGNSSRCNRSGRMPYLTGPNSEARQPNRNTAKNKTLSEWNAKPATPMRAAPISTNFTRWATKDLSKRSANSPPRPDRKKNGAINVAPASWVNDAALAPFISNTMMNSKAVLRKLSPNAAKNWHQNSGAKRRDVINEMDMLWTWLYGARAVPLADFRLVHDGETW